MHSIHGAGISHLDLKPANIFIEANGNLRIGDFGLSTRKGFDHDPDLEGDKVYMAPECLEGRFDFPADVFSLGLVILELAADVVLPGEGPSWLALRNEMFHELSFEDVSPALVDSIQAMLARDPTRRSAISQILQRISQEIPATSHL